MRPFALSVALVSTLLVSACYLPPEPSPGVYRLATVNDQPLPQTYGSNSAVELTGGTLALHRDGTFAEEFEIRCKESLPQGTTCHVEGDGRVHRAGTYSESQGWIEYDGTRFPATFSAAEVTIVYGAGTDFPTVFEYQR